MVRGEVVGEADREVQKERRLKRLRRHVAPVDEPVEAARFAGGSEAVKDKRDQTEDVEVDGLWSGPAAEQDIDADAEIDQRDESKPLIDGAVFGFENYLDVQLSCAMQIDRLRNRAKDRVSGMGPDAAAKHLPGERGNTRGRLVVNADENVAGTYAGPMARGDRWNTFGPEPGGRLDPPDPISRDVESALPIEVHGRENTGGDGRYGENDCQNASLGGVVHENLTVWNIISTLRTKRFRPSCTTGKAFCRSQPTKNHNLFRNSRGYLKAYAADVEIVHILLIYMIGRRNF